MLPILFVSAHSFIWPDDPSLAVSSNSTLTRFSHPLYFQGLTARSAQFVSMMFDSKLQMQRAMFYTIIAVFALAYMGAGAEACSLFVTCPARLSGVIAMGVLTAFLALGALGIVLAKMSSMIELGLVGVALITNTAAAAIITSPESVSSTLPITLWLPLPWTCEALLIASLFILLGGEENDSSPKLPTATPSPAYNPPAPSYSTSVPMPPGTPSK